nr:hypothetical protein [uncultured Marinifilum sp.]
MGELTTNKIIEEITSLIDDSYKLEVDNTSTIDNISTWIVGLATGGFLVTISKLTIKEFEFSETKLLIILLSYLGTLILTLVLKLSHRSYNTASHQIRISYKILKIKLLNKPELIENDIEENNIYQPYINFYDGKYFDDKVREEFTTAIDNQGFAGKVLVGSFIFIILSFILEYIMIYLLFKEYIVG